MSRWLLGMALATALALSGCLTDSRMSTIDLQADAAHGTYQVDGAVRLPGTFHLPPGKVITLELAIRRSGGVIPGNTWNDGGDLTAVRVQRVVSGSVVEYTVDASPGQRDEAFIIKPGDCIRVPDRTFSTPISNPLPFAD